MVFIVRAIRPLVKVITFTLSSLVKPPIKNTTDRVRTTDLVFQVGNGTVNVCSLIKLCKRIGAASISTDVKRKNGDVPVITSMTTKTHNATTRW